MYCHFVLAGNKARNIPYRARDFQILETFGRNVYLADTPFKLELHKGKLTLSMLAITSGASEFLKAFHDDTSFDNRDTVDWEIMEDPHGEIFRPFFDKFDVQDKRIFEKLAIRGYRLSWTGHPWLGTGHYPIPSFLRTELKSWGGVPEDSYGSGVRVPPCVQDLMCHMVTQAKKPGRTKNNATTKKSPQLVSGSRRNL